MYYLKIKDTISSAHKIQGYPGKCADIHGHNWEIIVTVKSDKLNEIGMCYDFSDFKKIVVKVLEKLDHTNLNEIDYFEKHNPTAESIAEYIYFQIKNELPVCVDIHSVEVFESNSSSVIFQE